MDITVDDIGETMGKVDYMDPHVISVVDAVDIPVVRATPENIKGYGLLVDHPDDQPIEIVQWPALGWRSIDDGTGHEGGTGEGDFRFWWDGGVLYGRNEAVDDAYVLGWDHDPSGDAKPHEKREHVYLWHANYHPDGGQLFFPLEPKPFVAPLALPGDDLKPSDFVGFHFDGSQGLYIHPGVWHEAIIPVADELSFLDRQGKVHARVSCFIIKEFGVNLRVSLNL